MLTVKLLLLFAIPILLSWLLVTLWLELSLRRYIRETKAADAARIRRQIYPSPTIVAPTDMVDSLDRDRGVDREMVRAGWGEIHSDPHSVSQIDELMRLRRFNTEVDQAIRLTE